MNASPAAAADSEFPDSQSEVTPDIAAEAAVWVARLHGPDRSPAMDRECRAWQARSAAHRTAFERCTDTWQAVAGISLADAYAAAAHNAPAAAGRTLWRPGRARWTLAATVVLIVSLVGVVLHPWRDSGDYRTGVGEQRVVVLDDGTRMSLNTDTRVRVALGASDRVVRMERGEALFEVAKDPRRPFVVRASSSEVVAIGTVFAVRLTNDDSRPQDTLSVTLIEGQVNVRAASGGGGWPMAASRRSSPCRCSLGSVFASSRRPAVRRRGPNPRWTDRASSK